MANRLYCSSMAHSSMTSVLKLPTPSHSYVRTSYWNLSWRDDIDPWPLCSLFAALLISDNARPGDSLLSLALTL